MKAKTLKEAISNIPDDANIALEYSTMLFGEQFDEVLVTKKEDIRRVATNELDVNEEDAQDLSERYDYLIHFEN